MNPHWESFLAKLNARLQGQQSSNELNSDLLGRTTISVVPNLSVLSVRGADAATFLQGQTTCNILALDCNSATFGAICNPKGRALTTFLLVKTDDSYLIILPNELLASIEKKLRLYILRSDVDLCDVSADYCLIGIANVPDSLVPNNTISLPNDKLGVSTHKNSTSIKVSENRWLIITNHENAIDIWNWFVQTQHFVEANPSLWDVHEILDGIPWLSIKTRELFVPQMFNLDVLGGISFDKGCYTGQEIIARTHYLGKQKRRMYLASIQTDKNPQPATPIYVFGNQQSIGQVVNAVCYYTDEIHALLVLQMEHANSEEIVLAEPTGIPVKILTLPYTFQSTQD